MNFIIAQLLSWIAYILWFHHQQNASWDL